MTQEKILVLVGGAFNSIDEKFWRLLSEQEEFNLDFAISKWRDGELQLSDWLKSRVVWIDEESPVEVGLAYENLALKITKHPPETKPFNTLMMWHKWARFCLFDHLSYYDCVIKARADIEIKQDAAPGISKAIKMTLGGVKNLLVIPSGGDHGGSRKGINDVLAIGAPSAIKIYLSIINFWPNYYQSVKIFHPETLLRFHLADVNQMHLIRFPALIYLRGVEYNHRVTRWYRDTLRIKSNIFQKKYDRFKRTRKIF